MRIKRFGKKRVYERASVEGGILSLVLGVERPSKQEQILRGLLFSVGFSKRRKK